jgi:hypothetical protein
MAANCVQRRPIAAKFGQLRPIPANQIQCGAGIGAFKLLNYRVFQRPDKWRTDGDPPEARRPLRDLHLSKSNGAKPILHKLIPI